MDERSSIPEDIKRQLQVVEDRQLKDDDWSDTCGAVSSISAKWRELAINLGLKPSDVESIAHNFSNDRDCLSEVLKYWLQLNFNYQRNGLPSWRTLALAVYKIKVDLFHRIAGMYQIGDGNPVLGYATTSNGQDFVKKQATVQRAAPQLSHLLPVLTDLPADKLVQFAIALGVPETAIKTAEKNHPNDVERVKMECLEWWINNSDEVSWEAITRALETNGVDQKNLAKKIQSGQCVQSSSTLNTRALSAEAGPGGEAAALNTADPGSWTIQRVVQYFSETTDCKEFATVCEKQEIDGSALLTLTAETLVKCLDIKLGPATKIVRHVEKLRPKS